MTVSDFIGEAIELDSRASDGIDIRLVRASRQRERCPASVFDTGTEQAFEINVEPARDRRRAAHRDVDARKILNAGSGGCSAGMIARFARDGARPDWRC